MPWNPEVYNQFKEIRFRPFFDLLNMISGEDLQNGVDLGCGTGELTAILAKKFAQATFLGIDPSIEMLGKSAAWASEQLRFETGTVEDFANDAIGSKLDLICSNAALQWSNNHPELFPQLIARLSEKGQFAIQMPSQTENLLNRIVLQLVQEEPFAGFLNHWKRESPVLTLDEYVQIMFDCGLYDIQVIQKVYPIIADTPDTLFDFISGSALIPYQERMTAHQYQEFELAFKRSIEKAFLKFPAIYSFKRLLLYGRRTQAPNRRST